MFLFILYLNPAGIPAGRITYILERRHVNTPRVHILIQILGSFLYLPYILFRLVEIYSRISRPRRIYDDVADLYEAVAVNGRGNVCFGAISITLAKAEADGDVVVPTARLDVEMEDGFIDVFRRWGVVFAVSSVVEVLGNVVGELAVEPADTVDRGVFESAAFVV